MKVLVTGANGFIGSNLCRRLIAEGNKVHALVRKTSDLSFLKGLNLKLFYGDIEKIETLQPAVKDVNMVFHVAGLAADWGPYKLFERINFRGTQNVAHVADEEGVKRFIYVSTVAFHGFGKKNMTEKSPKANKLIPYAKTKYLSEQWLWQFSKHTDMGITAVRPGNVFGINDRTFISKYIDALLRGKFAEINHGRSKTCPVYVENLIDIIMLISKNKKAIGEAYLATDGLDITWHEFNSALAQKLDVKLPRISIPYSLAMPVAKGYYGLHRLLKIKSEPFLTPYRINNGGRDYHFSIQKLRDHFGYQPKVELEEAMRRTVDWYRSKQ